MDPKLLLLFFVAAVATTDNCVWKRGSYISLVLELMFKLDKEGICETMETFRQKIQNRTCFNPEEKLVFEAFKESCDSKCNLYQALRSGKYYAFQLSLSRDKLWACMNFPAIEKLLKEQECHELHTVFTQFMHDCSSDPSEFKLEVNLTDKAN